jgi:hypothetical protein
MKPITFTCEATLPQKPEEIASQILDLSRWPEFNGYGPLPGIREAEFETTDRRDRRDVRGRESGSRTGRVWLEAAGIEPASRDISMKASTCVANCLCLVAAPPIDKATVEPARSFF